MHHQTGFTVVNFQPQPPEEWDCKCIPWPSLIVSCIAVTVTFQPNTQCGSLHRFHSGSVRHSLNSIDLSPQIFPKSHSLLFILLLLFQPGLCASNSHHLPARMMLLKWRSSVVMSSLPRACRIKEKLWETKS